VPLPQMTETARMTKRPPSSVSSPSALPGPPAPVSPPPYTFRFSAGEARVFRPRERDPRTGMPITVSYWADHYRIVTEGGRKGPWSTDFAAYAREPMDAWNLPYVREIVLCWPPQSSKSQFALNCLGYSMDQDPGPAMWITPNEKKSKDAISKKIKPMIRSSRRLSELLSPRERDATNFNIRLTNGMETMVAWATSAAQLATESIRYVIFDETDKYEDFTGREADPISLGEQRVISYPHTYKILKLSTPTSDTGVIWTALNDEVDEIRDYHVPCPVCHEYQVMIFDNITYPSDLSWQTIQANHQAWYTCARCGMKWTDRDKNVAVRSGRWIPRVPAPNGRPSSIGYHLSRWYSPFCSFSQSVVAYLRGMEEAGKMMVFITQHKAEGHSERIETLKDHDVLVEHRTTTPAHTVPAGHLILTAGYDSHKDYFKFTVWSWDEHLNRHLVDYGVLTTLDDVEAHCFDVRYPVQDAPEGEVMSIWRASIDIGGGKGKTSETTQTEAVKQWLHKVKIRRTVFAVKGASHHQAKKVVFSLIGAAPKGKKSRRIEAGKLELRMLDTDVFKNDVHWSIDRAEGQKERMTFHAGCADDFVRELLAEEKHRDRRGNVYWKKVRNANHYLDCTVYAFACADSEWLPSLPQLAARLRAQRGDARGLRPVPAGIPVRSGRRVRSQGVE
jgi:phage terminase large subunit GpA-like protein